MRSAIAPGSGGRSNLLGAWLPPEDGPQKKRDERQDSGAGESQPRRRVRRGPRARSPATASAVRARRAPRRRVRSTAGSTGGRGSNRGESGACSRRGTPPRPTRSRCRRERRSGNRPCRPAARWWRAATDTSTRSTRWRRSARRRRREPRRALAACPVERRCLPPTRPRRRARTSRTGRTGRPPTSSASAGRRTERARPSPAGSKARSRRFRPPK